MRDKGTQLYSGSVHDVFLEASTILFDSISHTLGRDGLNTAIPTSNGFLSIINDGKTILESISSDDTATKFALNTLKESAFATNMNAGDGTTSTTILQHILLSNILSSDKCITHKDVLRVRDVLLEALSKYKKEIEDEIDLSKVISVALGKDDLVDVVRQSFIYNGLDGKTKPSLIKGSDPETTVLNIDGVSLHPVEINPIALRTIPVSLDEEMNIIIITQNISRIDQAVASMLKKMSQSNKKTILLYTEIMPSVMDQILFNIQEGSLPVIPVRLNIPLNELDDYVRELASYFNLTPIDDLNPYQTVYSDPKIFGTCLGYIINKDSIVIKNNNTEYMSELLPARSTVIQVGFITYSQQEEDYRRIEDAIHSAYNSLQSGYTVGSGYTLLCLINDLYELLPDVEPEILVEFVNALNYIFITLSRGEADTQNSQDYIDYCMENVFDSYKVTEQVLLNSFTVVAQVLSTRRLIIPIK